MFARHSRSARAPKCKSLSPRVLRCEQLESRSVLSAVGLLGSLPDLTLGLGPSPAKTGPSVVQAANAAVNSAGAVTGTSTTLSVQGSDPAGASSLVYDWKVVTAPPGGAVQFAVNNNNTAQNDTVTFVAAGTYSISVTIMDGSGLSTTSSVKVVVAQTPSGVNLYSGGVKTLVTPATTLNVTGKSETLNAVAIDQFGKALATQPAFIWTATTEPGGAAPSFAAAGSGETVTFNEAGSYTIAAQTGDSQFSAAANVNVAQTPASFVVTPLGGSAKVAGTSAQFTVGQFLDQFGNPIAESSTAAWSAKSLPSGAAAPQFSTSGGATTVAFTHAGTYTLSVKQSDGSGNSVSESVSVVVGQTLSGMSIESSKTAVTSTLNVSGKNQTLTAVGFDQFGNTMTAEPAFTWTAATEPGGAAPTLAAAGSGETVTFNEAGFYTIAAQTGGTQFSAAANVNVAQTPASFVVTPLGGSGIVLGTSAQFTVGQFLDQFGNPIAESSTAAWSAKGLPSGAAAPQFSTSGGVTTVTFSHAGTYTLSVKQSDGSGNAVSESVSVVVGQTLSGMSIESGKTVVTSTLNVSGKNETLIAAGFDQFGNAMTAKPAFTWMAATEPSGAALLFAVAGSGETVTFNEAGDYTIVAQAGGTQFSATASFDVVQTPTSFVVAQVGGIAKVAGTAAQFSVGQFLDQFGNPIAESTTAGWSAKSLPSGAAAPQFSSSGGATTVTFSHAGTYTLSVAQSDGSGNAVSESVSVVVAQTPTGIATCAGLTVTGVSQKLSAPAFLDQFGNPISGLSGLVWTATATPSGAPAVTFSGTTATFGMAGSYVLMAQPANSTAACDVPVTVVQTLTGIAVTPGTAIVAVGAAEQFQAAGLDQFRQAMATAATVAWTATGGTINSAGLFTAGSTTGTYHVTASSGSLKSPTTVTVATPGPAPAKLQDPVLACLVAQLDADGSLSRADMIQILTSVGAGGTLSATDLGDLKAILADAAAYNMPNYVQVLANDVVKGNVANATYQGATLGNLAAGSSALQLDDLIGKWFYGSDLPTVTGSSITYETVSGSLFPSTPSNHDEYQGELGDCYFISSLGAIADSNPSAIENMFVNNGDGTYTVRFYSSSGTADYVSVNLELPTSNGVLIYADYGASPTNANNSLWIPLAEKAYAEWNQTGNEGRDGTNTYNSIQGGWMADVDAQVLGHGASSYSPAPSSEQAMIGALAGDQAVTIGTDTSSNSNDTLPGNLYGSHAYAVLGYNASSSTFTLYNPWGFDQPSALTWSQLEATCDGFVTTVTSGSTPISGGVASSLGAASLSAATSVANSAVTSVRPSSVAWSTVPAAAMPAVAAAGNGATSQPAAIFSALPGHGSASHATNRRPLAAGVDAVLGGVEIGEWLAVGRFAGTMA